MQNRKGIQVECAVNDHRQMWEEDVGGENVLYCLSVSNLCMINYVTLF